jgi:hypothetical protein
MQGREEADKIKNYHSRMMQQMMQPQTALETPNI